MCLWVEVEQQPPMQLFALTGHGLLLHLLAITRSDLLSSESLLEALLGFGVVSVI